MYEGKIYFSCPDLDKLETEYQDYIVVDIPENHADCIKLYGSENAVLDVVISALKIDSQNKGRGIARGKKTGKSKGHKIERV